MSSTEERAALRDGLGRPLGNLRLSVTDRCNLRCSYCMPEASYTWLPRAEILTFEEATRLVDLFTALGVRRVRLTGGEPLLRSELSLLVRMLAQRPAIEDLSMTTNAVQLEAQAAALHQAGLDRITVSLDTLQPERFHRLTRRADHGQVMAGLRRAVEVGFPLKINVVVVRGFNDDELAGMIELGRELGAEIRFIEYMDVGGATQWAPGKVVTRMEILKRLEQRYGKIDALPASESAPATRQALSDGTVFGIIASTTAPFCRSCDRSRLTADGVWYHCLYAMDGTNLREILRAGASQEEIVARLTREWKERTDRGAEERLRLKDRRPSLDSAQLRAHPHREMHTRGG